MAYKAYKPALDEIHRNFSGRFEGGESKKMSVFEFVEILQLSGLMPHHVHELLVREAFVTASMLSTDELANDKHMFLSEVEFYEAVSGGVLDARAACNQGG